MSFSTPPRSLRALFLVLVGVGLTACPTTHPQGDAGVPATADGGVAIGDAPLAVDPRPDAPTPRIEPDAPTTEPVTCQDAAAYCEALYECGSEARLAWERERFWHRDVLDCMAIMKPLFDVACDALYEAAAAGTTVLAREALAGCRSPRVSCEERLEDAWPFDRCAGSPLAVGRGGRSEPCRWDHECGVGLWCDVADGAHLPPGETVGACEPLPGEGEACKPGRCAGELTCVEAVCVDLEVALLDPCVLDVDCGPNSRCDQPGNDFASGAEGIEGVCRPRGGIGAPCDEVSACSPGLTCSGEHDATGRLPGACIVLRSSDEPCVHAEDCASGACIDGVCAE